MMLLICRITLSIDVNIAINKVVYPSTLVSGKPTMITDGITSTQCAVTNNVQPRIVIDLGANTTISSVVIWTTTANSLTLNGYKIFGMDDWRTCYSNSYISSGTRNCGTIKVTKSITNVILNATKACYGRFIALGTTQSSQVSITICEIQIFGTLVNAIIQNPYERQCGVNNNDYLALDLAIGKTSFGSPLAGPELGYSIKYATDGKEIFNDQCFSTHNANNYYVLDLGAEVNISFVRIQSTYWDNSNVALYNAAISNTFQQCQFSQIFAYPLCKGTVVSNGPSDLWELKTDGKCIGRYFILRSINTTVTQWLKICEIEVYGAATTNNMGNVVSFPNSCSLSTDGGNVALGKLSISNSNNNLAMITDGILDQTDIWNMCFYSETQDSNFVVIDLGAFYQLKAIKVWNSRSGSDGNGFTINILVGQYLRLQYILRDVQNFKTVASNLPVADWFTVATLNVSDNIVAQYIMIQKVNNYIDPLIICELEVFGTIVSSKPPANRRPILIDSIIPQSSINNFPIGSILRKGASYAFLKRYSGYILSASAAVEGILWSPLAALPYAVAGTYGSGRFAAFGKKYYFKDTLNTKFDPVFKSNLYTWLSPTKGINANVISSTAIASANVGDIVLFDTTASLTTLQQQQLLNYLQIGKVSVVIEVTYWAELAYGSDRINYDFLLRALQIDFSGDYISDPDQQIPLSDNDFINNDYNNIPTKISNMLQSQTYLVTKGLDVAQTLPTLSDYLITNAISSGLQAILVKYWDLVTYICPGMQSPIQKGADEMLLMVFDIIINLQAVAQYKMKAPCVDLFPGDVTSSVNTVSSRLSIVAQNAYEIHSTGLYLLPGQILTYSTIGIQGQWMVAIGCHTDELYYEPDDSSYFWNRYPIVHSGFFAINSNNGTLYSPFGGVVWIENKDSTGSLTLQVSGVVRSPSFNIRDPNADTVWAQGILNPGLWTEVLGQYIIISASSNSLVGLSATDLRTIINNWDTAISLQHVLCGTNPNNLPRERIVIDLNIAYGYGHSGYPIMTTYPWFQNLFNISVISTPNSWGVIHELGHRRQESYYTSTGATEVTVNIFADFLWTYMWNVTYLGGNNIRFSTQTQQNIIDFFAGGALFSDWQSTHDVAYAIYGQLGYHYGFGLYQKVLTNYTIENPSPANDQAKIDLWITILSRYAGNNLASMFDFWGIPVSDNVKASLSTLPCFLPQDAIAALVPDRYNAISAQYNSACQGTPFQKLSLVVPKTLIINRDNDITIT